jgi:tetratricopeptide (TPR) repeat protein
LADSHILLGPWTEARANAVKALAIDDTLAEAHTSLAQLKFISDWDWLGAEREFKRAIELDPNYAMAMGRMPEALAEAKRAQELEPLSLIISAGLGEAFCTAQQYDTGIAQLKKTLEMDPNFVPALVTLGSVYTQRGMFREAISMLEKATALSQGHQRAFLGWSYARAGRKNDALKSLREFEKAGFQHGNTDLALLYAELGENDKAFASLERAYQQREYDLPRSKPYLNSTACALTRASRTSCAA